MQHSVKLIASNYQSIYEARKNGDVFDFDGFLRFAEKNADKYKIIKTDNDLFVSTWYSDNLIKDYLTQL